MQAPVLVLNTTAKREHGPKVQIANIQASKAVSDILRTTLGPRAMLKMVLDPLGGITMTNDGHAILREIDVSHPAAKSIIELSRTQDEEVGDGTTSVIILAGEMLSVALPFLARNVHPRVLVGAYMKAMDEAIAVMDRIAKPIDTSNKDQVLQVIRSSLGTKFVSRFGDLVCDLAYQAVKTVAVVKDRDNNVIPTEEKSARDGRLEVDFKRFARVEKIPGGFLEESVVMDGVMFNKDVVHPQMPRRIENPKVLLLDCPLEYKKGESQTHVEITGESDFKQLLEAEEKAVKKACEEIVASGANLVFCEKGISTLAEHYLSKAGIAAIRRVKKMDNDRMARATGATVVHETSQIKPEDIGSECGLFEVNKIGDEYYCNLTQCKNPKACTVVLRGGSKDVLNEIERNLIDAMNVARNILIDPRALPGGGATEMAIATAISTKVMEGQMLHPFRAVGSALEIIPKTLIDNCGGSAIRLLTALRAKHAESADNVTWGIDGKKGELADMKELGIWDTFLVKSQTVKTAIESACMLLRIDDIVSGMSKQQEEHPAAQLDDQDQETFGDARDG